MSYWGFFPAEPGWGRMPVWGFAKVLESRSEALEEGIRVYGYLPPAVLTLRPWYRDRELRHKAEPQAAAKAARTRKPPKKAPASRRLSKLSNR